MFKDWESKVTAIEEAKDLNSMPIESLINSQTSYELKLMTKEHEDEDAKAKRSIVLKASQDENDSVSLDDEDMDDNDLSLIAKSFKRILNKRRFRKGGPNNSNFNQFNITRNKEKQEVNKK